MVVRRRRRRRATASPKRMALRAKAYRAKAFETLLAQLKEMYPNRSTTGGPDGWLGDQSHAARASDHNPRSSGIVLAQDITHDPKHGFDSYKFCDMLISDGFRDDRLRYCISNGRIAGNEEFCKSNPGYHLTPWKWGKYTGANKHDKHCHLSLVRDDEEANNTRPWRLDAAQPVQPDHPEAEKRPTIRKGDDGEYVKQLQLMLGLEADGDFGNKTRDAVEDFQESHDIKPVDGIVGPYTWEALDKAYGGKVPDVSVIPPEELPTGPVVPPPASAFDLVNPPGYDQKAINEAVEESGVLKYNWPGRGSAPEGYIKGVASSFARAIIFYRQKHPIWVEMARSETSSLVDALNWYRNKFGSIGALNTKSGEDVIRHIFVLLLGLGMRESSGQYTEGRDMSAHNTNGETCEAGMFQTSYDVRRRAPRVVDLFKMYKEADADILLDVYKEGVHDSISRDYGEGVGREFQRLSKHSPDFAAQVAAIGLRTARDHWGPLNRREALVLKAADNMLKNVQDTIGKGALTS